MRVNARDTNETKSNPGSGLSSYQVRPPKKGQPRINIYRAALILVASIITASCSEKSPSDGEKDVNAPEASEMKTGQDGDESQPEKDEIEEDCAAFVSSTKAVPTRAPATNCAECPAGGTAVLAFRGVTTDAVSCSSDTCSAVVTIRAVYNPGSGERLAGGLTAWIPPEQRSAYLSGHTPSGEQVYRVKITYKLRGGAWRAVEFDRAPVK
jgi:hypothetical protein